MSEPINVILSKPIKVILSDEERRNKRKQQLREAQRRFYDTHKRKEKTNPVSYTPEYLQAYHKNYYQQHKEVLKSRAKQRYYQKKDSPPPSPSHTD